eukprot:962877_1
MAVTQIFILVTLSFHMIMSLQLKCGTSITSTHKGLETRYSEYYYLHTHSNEQPVQFDFCSSLQLPHIYVYDTQSNLIWDKNIQHCNTTLPTLNGEIYIIQIRHVWPWSLTVHCTPFRTNTASLPARRRLKVHNVTWRFDYLWNSAQKRCEDEFGSYLATLATRQDVMDSWDIVTWLSQPETDQTTVYTGLWKDALHNNQWHWIDGTPCNASTTNQCASDFLWDDSMNSANQTVETITQMFGVLTITPLSGNYSNTITSTIIQLRNHSSNLSIGGEEFSDYYNKRTSPLRQIACNQNRSKYTPSKCRNTLHCWTQITTFSDAKLIQDIAIDKDYFLSPVAFWNSTLFVVGLNQIHWTEFALFETEYMWHHVYYRNVSFNTTMHPFDYAQFQSNLYMHLIRVGAPNVLLHIDLNNLSNVTYIDIPNTFSALVDIERYESESMYCVVATDKYVAVIRAVGGMVYDLQARVWIHVELYPLAFQVKITCSVSKDHQIVYVFSEIGPNTLLVKFDFETNTGAFLEKPPPSVWPGYSAITGLNDKIYLQGIYTVSWKTIVFDTKTEQYQNYTVDIDDPIPRNIPFYRTSSLAMYDDNILLLFHATDDIYPETYDGVPFKHASLYYSITELISVNFTSTIQCDIWPSDGFDIRYVLNDFSDLSLDLYDIYFVDVENEYNLSIVLNTLHDDCVYINEYQRENCWQHLNICDYIWFNDGNIRTLQFIPMQRSFDVDVLLLPKVITLRFQYCNLSLQVKQTSTNNLNAIVTFLYDLSHNCYSRMAQPFVIYITTKTGNRTLLSKSLVITITNNTYHTCTICNYTLQNNCDVCHMNTFSLSYETKQVTFGDFGVFFHSNSTDLRILSAVANINYEFAPQTPHVDTENDQFYMYMLSLLIIGPCVILCVCIYCRRQYMKALVVDRALVLIIGISQFDNKDMFLSGVPQNVTALQHLWKSLYKYDVFVCNAHSLYCKGIEVQKFVDHSLQQMEYKQYKAVIVHVISHGTDTTFTTSDMMMMDKDFINHELVTKAEETKNKELIKLVFHHSCMGDADFSFSKFPLQTVTRNAGSFVIPAPSIQRTASCMTYDSNLIVISGNIKGRALSDRGDFTTCICKSFTNNLKRIIKFDFETLLKEIRINLEKETAHAELCHPEGIVSYQAVRFEKAASKYKKRDARNRVESKSQTQLAMSHKHGTEIAIQTPAFDDTEWYKTMDEIAPLK